MQFIAPPDRVAETSTTEGADDYVLAGAISGFQSVNAGIADGNRSLFFAEDRAGGGWENFIGTYTHSGTVLTRDRILKSSNSNNPVSWAAGTRNVVSAWPAELIKSNLILCPVDSTTVIEVRDMVWLDTDDVKPAADFAWDLDLGSTQAAFANVFLGVAIEASANGETADILVDISPLTAFADYPANTASYVIGDTLGPDENTGALHSQKLEGASASGSIARVLESTGSVSAVRVGFASAYYPKNTNGLVG